MDIEYIDEDIEPGGSIEWTQRCIPDLAKIIIDSKKNPPLGRMTIKEWMEKVLRESKHDQ